MVNIDDAISVIGICIIMKIKSETKAKRIINILEHIFYDDVS